MQSGGKELHTLVRAQLCVVAFQIAAAQRSTSPYGRETILSRIAIAIIWAFFTNKTDSYRPEAEVGRLRMVSVGFPTLLLPKSVRRARQRSTGLKSDRVVAG